MVKGSSSRDQAIAGESAVQAARQYSARTAREGFRNESARRPAAGEPSDTLDAPSVDGSLAGPLPCLTPPNAPRRQPVDPAQACNAAWDHAVAETATFNAAWESAAQDGDDRNPRPSSSTTQDALAPTHAATHLAGGPCGIERAWLAVERLRMLGRHLSSPAASGREGGSTEAEAAAPVAGAAARQSTENVPTLEQIRDELEALSGVLERIRTCILLRPLALEELHLIQSASERVGKVSGDLLRNISGVLNEHHSSLQALQGGPHFDERRQRLEDGPDLYMLQLGAASQKASEVENVLRELMSPRRLSWWP